MLKIEWITLSKFFKTINFRVDRRTRVAEERSTNLETFGVASAPRTRGRGRGRGGGRGKGRGGPSNRGVQGNVGKQD